MHYECNCCGRKNVPAKLKGIGYYCDVCLDAYLWDEYVESCMRAGRKLDREAPPEHYPVCPFKEVEG